VRTSITPGLRAGPDRRSALARRILGDATGTEIAGAGFRVSRGARRNVQWAAGNRPCERFVGAAGGNGIGHESILA